MNVKLTTVMLIIATVAAAPVHAQWVVFKTFPGHELRDVEVFDANRAWVLTARDTIFRTTNGGTSWVGSSVGPESLRAVKFGDPVLGMVVGANDSVRVSINGGQTWANHHTGVDATYQDVDIIIGVSQFAWVVGNAGTILRYSGGTWLPPMIVGDKNLFGVDFIDANTGWAVGGAGTILYTTDGGAKWDPPGVSATSAVLQAVSFVSPDRGWAVGDAGTIITTNSGGATWSALASGTNANLFDVSFLNDNEGVVVGGNGTILHTKDGGASWRPEGNSPPVPVTFGAVHFQDVAHCWVVQGETGELLYSRGLLNVLFPNGGEVIEGGSQFMITWASDYIDVIKIEFTLNGSDWLSAGLGSGGVNAPAGSFAWDVPDDVSSSTCRVRLTAVNEANLVAMSQGTFEIFVPDRTAPTITSNPVVESSRLASITVDARITDDGYGVQTAELHYRLSGETDFKTLTMETAGQDSFSAVIPRDDSESIRGYEYYIRAVDASPTPNESTSPAGAPQSALNFVKIHVVDYSRNVVGSTPEDPHYQMVSIPLNFGEADGSVDLVFVDDFGSYDRKNWRLFRWSTSGEANLESQTGEFVPGRAFWLATRQGVFDMSNGTSVEPEDFKIALEPAVNGVTNSGWHQIANPFAFSVSWNSVLASSGNPSGWDNPHFYNPETNAYQVATILDPWTGYFFKNPTESPDTLVIPPVESGAGTNRLAPIRTADRNEWALQLKLSCGSSLDNFNYCGVSTSASRERDAQDHLQPPAIDRSIALYFPHLEWTKFADNYTTDFRPHHEDGDLWNIVVTSNMPVSEAELRVTGIEAVPREFGIYLFDPQFDVEQDLREISTYRFPSPPPGAEKKLILVVGGEDFLADRGLSASTNDGTIKLYQNFPNPFNPSTAIRFTLTGPSTVDLDVFGVRGEHVASLLRGAKRGVGHQVVIWNGDDDFGNRVPSGFYFYRLTVGSFSETKKMLLLK